MAETGPYGTGEGGGTGAAGTGGTGQGGLGDPMGGNVGTGSYYETVPGMGAETKEEMATRWAVKNKAVFVGVVILTLLAVK